MPDNLVIRPEMPADYKETELMTMRSFWNKYRPGCSEHFLIRIIRESVDYIPGISHIAEVDGKIVGAVSLKAQVLGCRSICMRCYVYIDSWCNRCHA